MVCTVKMGSYPNFTDGVQWTVRGDGLHGMEHDNSVESWAISGCDNHSVIFFEHGDPNHRQQAHALTNGTYQRYNDAYWINAHGPYASPLSGISSVKIQSPGGESITKGGKIIATIEVPDEQGPRAQESYTVSNWDNYLKPNYNHGLTNHCPGADWSAWKHAKTSNKKAQALCRWPITENNMAALAASNETHVKGAYNTIISRVCNAIKNDHPNFKTGKGDEKCWDLVNTQEFMKDYCYKENRMADDSLCSETSLGDSYAILADEYCKQNPDKDFCKCYNVVNYETVCANRGTSAGCPEAKEVYDKYVEFEIPDPNVYLPCGSACKGARNYKPSGYNAGCDGTINACIQKVEIGASHDEVNVACNIDSSSGLTTGGSDDASGSGGSSGSGDASGSGGSSSVPLSTTQTSDLEKTVAEMKKEKEEEEEEDKKTKKKLLIGGGTGGILSSISFLMLIVLIIMVMSKQGGGRRRR